MLLFFRFTTFVIMATLLKEEIENLTECSIVQSLIKIQKYYLVNIPFVAPVWINIPASKLQVTEGHVRSVDASSPYHKEGYRSCRQIL